MAEGSGGRWLYEDSVDILHILFPGSRLNALADQNEIGKRVELRDQIDLDDPFLQTLCVETGLVCRDREIDYLYVETLFLSIGLRLIRRHAIGSLPPNSEGKGSKCLRADWQPARVRDRLLSGLGGDFNLVDLAGEARLSPFHFARLQDVDRRAAASLPRAASYQEGAQTLGDD